MPDRDNLREEGFILAPDFRRFNPSWQGGHGGAEQVTPW
jgi:hypothetical protein